MAWNDGNRWGRLGHPITDQIRKAALAGDARKLRLAVDRMWDSAAEGPTWQERHSAMSYLTDRLEGKAIARIETAGDQPRELELADLVRLVLQARTADASDATTIDAAPALQSQEESKA